MAQLISGLDSVYKRSKNSWQDTSAPPNILIRALGPGRTSLTLQFNLDITGQPYHRESLKGQTVDVPNLRPLFSLAPPPLLALTPDDTSGEMVRRDSIKGQVADPQNFLLLLQITGVSVTPRQMLLNPVFNKHPTQETTIQRNPVLDIITAGSLPFPSPIFESEQGYRHDSLSGQYGRGGAVVPLGVPPAFNEIFTYVAKGKTAQEPFIYPNRVLIGIPPPLSPFVHMQSEDHQWRRPKVQEPYLTPNILAVNLKTTSPFVHGQSEDLTFKAHAAQEPYLFPNLVVLKERLLQIHQQSEDLQWRRPKTQETYELPNVLIRALPPVFVLPFVEIAGSDLHWRSPKTQEHYDFPNALFYGIPPLPPPVPTGFRVMAVTAGWYLNVFRTPGDVFDLVSALDFSNAAIDYQPPSSNTTGYGWMLAVSPNTPLFNWLEANNAPYLPPQDPLRRFIM